MKKNELLHFAATQQQATKSSNWKFGWSAASVDAAIAGRRAPYDRQQKNRTSIDGAPMLKAASLW